MKASGGFELFFAVLGGAAVGALAGLLLAPAPGAETRRRLAEALRERRRVPVPAAERDELGTAAGAYGVVEPH